MQITEKYNDYRTVFSIGLKGLKHNVKSFSSCKLRNVDSDTMKLQNDAGVCQRKEGNSAGDIYAGHERKKHDILYSDSNKSLTTRCNENNLRLHEKLLLSQ